MLWAVYPSAACHSTAVVAISISITAVLLYHPGDPSCSEQAWFPTGFGDCLSSDLDSSSGNGDIVSLLQSVKMPVTCIGAGCKKSGTSQTPIADTAPEAEVKDVSRLNAEIARLTRGLEQHEKEAAHTLEAVPSKSEVEKIAGLNKDISRLTQELEKQQTDAQAGSTDTSIGPHGKTEKNAFDIDFRLGAAAKHFSASIGAHSLGLSVVPVIVLVLVVLVVLAVWLMSRGSTQRPSGPYTGFNSEGVINRSSEIPRPSLQPARKYSPNVPPVTQSADGIGTSFFSAMHPANLGLMAQPQTQPGHPSPGPMQQSPETRYVRSPAQSLRSPVPSQSGQVLASRQSPLNSSTSIGSSGSGGRYILPLEDVVALSYDDYWHFNVEDAASNAIIPVEIKLTAGSKKLLEISEFYQVGTSRAFATACTSPESAGIVQVSLNGAPAASIQGNDTGGYVIMQQGRINYTVDGDITKRETVPWITVRHSSGIAATMVMSHSPMFGQKMEVLKLEVARDYNAKLILACVLGIIAFFDWPKPAR